MAGLVIFDFSDARSLQTDPTAVLVVGSGAAGMALAERLSQAGRPIVLLESGADLKAGSEPAVDVEDLNTGVNVGLPYVGLTDGRSRNFGGTTQLWHGQCTRLHEIDVEQRDWVPNSGWPITLAELDPYYRDAERWMQVSGKGYGASRWEEHPDLAPLAWNTDHLLHDFTEYTPKPMLGREHRPGLVANALVQVIVNATVARVLIVGERVSGVEVLGPDGRREQISGAQVVLCAGAIENARLLQLSDPDGIGVGTGRMHTGRYLQDHPTLSMGQVFATDYRVLQDRYVALHKKNRRLFPKVRLAPSAQRRHGLLDATAVFVHEHDEPGLAAARRLLLGARARRMPADPWPDVRTAIAGAPPVLRDTYRRYVKGRATGARPSAVWLQVWLEQSPDPASRITLSSTPDSLGLPRAEVHWSINDQVLQTSRLLTRWIAEDLRRLGIAEVRELAPMQDDDAWRSSVRDAFHPSGTTRMALRPEDGVLDPHLAVHAVAGLSVLGASVFPTAGYANPTLTIVALAFRLADRLLADTRGVTGTS
jgi:choline dehydrogenase-like flavoprotein